MVYSHWLFLGPGPGPGQGPDQDQDEWVEWFYVELFTLLLNRDMEEWVMYPFSRS